METTTTTTTTTPVDHTQTGPIWACRREQPLEELVDSLFMTADGIVAIVEPTVVHLSWRHLGVQLVAPAVVVVAMVEGPGSHSQQQQQQQQ